MDNYETQILAIAGFTLVGAIGTIAMKMYQCIRMKEQLAELNEHQRNLNSLEAKVK